MMWGWAISLVILTVCRSCTSGTVPGSEVLPSLDDILTKAADTIVGEYSISKDCKAVLTSVDENKCEIRIVAKPDGCITLKLLADKLLGSGSDTAQDIVSSLPSSVAIAEVRVDVCGEVLEITVTSTEPFTLIPGVVSVSDVRITVKLLIPTKALEFDVTGTWQIGQIRFTVSASKNDKTVAISGQPEPASKEFNIGEIVSSVSSQLFTGNGVRNAVDSMGLNNLRIKDVVLETAFSDRGLAVRLSFKALSSAMGNPQLYLTINSLKNGATSNKGISIAGSFTNLQISTLFKQLTKLDISGIPFVGSTTFKTLDVIASTLHLGEPILPYSHEALASLSPVVAGMQILTDIQFTPNGNPSKVKITVSSSLIKFEILTDSGISVSAFVDKLISNLGPLSLPPKFSLQSFLDLRLEGFEYDPGTKIFTLPVELPESIVFVPKAIELEDATIVFNIRTGSTGAGTGGRFGIDVMSNWKLGNLNIPLTISKPLDLNVFLAESRPNVEIPFGGLIQKFLVSILPSGKLEDAVKKVGFQSFYISNPYVKIYFASNMVLKISGTAVIGAWDKCQVEVMLGQVSGSFVMATGIVLTDVPITKLVKKVTDNALDLSKLPGSSILDATDVAISMSSQNVPKVQQFMQFSIPALSNVEILDGVSLMTAFKFPKDCTDTACKTFKRLLGANAQLVLKGRLYLASVYISATVPTQIQIYRGINITDVGFEVEMGVQRNAIGLKGTLQIPNPALTFIGGFGISTSGVYLQMSMAGWWTKPFGIPFFAIGNLHLRASIVPDPILLSAVEFGGQGKLGLLDNNNAKPLEVSMYCGIDRVFPIENFFQGSFTSLTLPDLLAAFAYRPSLPKPLREIGFPQGMNTSFAFKTKVLPNGITIPRGYFLQGMLKVLFFEAYADVKLSFNGIYVDLTVKPFKIGKSGLVEVSGRNSNSGPRIFVDVGWNPPRAFINIEGRLKVLGITAYTNLTVDHKGLEFQVSGSFLNYFEAGLKIRSSYDSIKTADFQVDGYFKQNLFDKLEKDVRDDMNNYKRNADRAIDNAKSDVENAKKKFDDASKSLLNAQNDVNAQKRHFDNANRDLQNKKNDLLSKKKHWEDAVRKMQSARDAVSREQRKFDSAIRDLQNKQRNSCPSPCRKRKTFLLLFHSFL